MHNNNLQGESKLSKKRKIIIFFFLISTLFIGLLKLPSYVKKVTVEHLEELTGRKVSSEKLKFNYFTSTLYLENFKIFEKDNENIFVAFDSFDININPVQLIMKTLYIKEITLVNPQIHLEFLDNRRNFDDILEKFAQEKIKETEIQVDQEKSSKGFLKNIEIKNISIENLTLYYLDEIIETNNKFTLKSPEVIYGNNVFKFSTKIDFLDESIADMTFFYENPTSEFQGSLILENFVLSDKLYPVEKFLNLKDINGSMDLELQFNGNIKESVYIFSGDMALEDFNITNDKKILSLRRGRFIFPTLDINSRNFDISKIDAQGLYFDHTQNPWKKDKNSEAETAEKKEKTPQKSVKLYIAKMIFSDSTFIDEDYKLNKLSLKIENFRNSLGTSFPLKLSVNLNGDTEIKTQSQFTLLKDFKNDFTIGPEAMSGAGNLEIKGKNLSFIEKFTKEKLPFTVFSGAFSYRGDYEYTFPLLTLGVEFDAEKVGIKEKNNSDYFLDIDKTTMNNIFTLDVTDYLYDFTGPVKLENFKFAGKDASLILGGESIEGEINSVKNSTYLLNTLNTQGLYVNIQPGEKEENSPEKDTDFPRVNISTLTMKDGSFSHPNFKGGNVDLTGSDIGTLKEDSSFDLSFLYNNRAPVKFNGKIKKDGIIENKDDFKNLAFSGEVSAKKVDLQDMNFILEKTPYKLEGVADLDSSLSYRKSALKTKNSVYGENIGFFQKAGEDSVKLKSATGNFDLNMKNSDTHLLDGEFVFNGIMGKSGDKRPMVSIEALSLSLPRADKESVSISNMKITKPVVNLQILKNEDNLIFTKKTEATDSENKPQKSTISLPEVNISNGIISDGKMNFFTEDINYSLKDIELSLKNFSTSKDKEFSLNMESGLTGVGKLDINAVSSLEKNWDFSPKNFNLDGFLKVSNLDLLDFNDFLNKYLPNRFDSGKIYYTGKMDLKKGKFSGENILTVKNIQLGKKTGVESSVPLGLAVKVLKDRKNQLVLDVPVSGDFNNPTFKIYKVVLQTITNIFVRAAASPVTILASTFNFNSDEIQTISFDLLSSDLKAKEIKKLEKISEVLEAKENLRVSFTLFNNLETEKDLLNEKLKENMIFKRDTSEEKLKREVYSVMTKRRENIIKFFEKRLLEKRIDVDLSPVRRDRPQASVDFIIE